MPANEKLFKERGIVKIRKRNSKTRQDYALADKAYRLFKEEKYGESLKIVHSELKKKDEGFFYWLKAQILQETKDISGAAICFEKAADLDSENELALGFAGHFFGEVMLDYEKSFQYFERTFQVNPADSGNALNYAESLITVKRYQEGYNLADKVFSEERDIFKILAAYFIKVYSLFLLEKNAMAVNQLDSFTKFYSLAPLSVKKTLTIWEFNKLRKFIQEQINDSSVSQILVATTKLIRQEISIDDYMEKLSEFLNNYSIDV